MPGTFAAAAETLRKGEWCKGVLKNKDGAYCAVGALAHVLGVEPPFEQRSSYDDPNVVSQARIDCYAAIAGPIADEVLTQASEMYPPPSPTTYGWFTVVDFNDDDETEKEHVLAVLDRAAQLHPEL